jgi:hypothetical protein
MENRGGHSQTTPSRAAADMIVSTAAILRPLHGSGKGARQGSANSKPRCEGWPPQSRKSKESDGLIEDLLQRRSELRFLNASKDATADLSADSIRTAVRRVFSDIPSVLRNAPQEAKHLLAEHLQEIKMVPQNDGSHLAYSDWDLLGIRDPVMVAGAGFEPATFGL